MKKRYTDSNNLCIKTRRNSIGAEEILYTRKVVTTSETALKGVLVQQSYLGLKTVLSRDDC